MDVGPVDGSNDDYYYSHRNGIDPGQLQAEWRDLQAKVFPELPLPAYNPVTRQPPDTYNAIETFIAHAQEYAKEHPDPSGLGPRIGKEAGILDDALNGHPVIPHSGPQQGQVLSTPDGFNRVFSNLQTDINNLTMDDQVNIPYPEVGPQ